MILSQAMKNCSNLVMLGLAGNKVSAEGADVFFESLTENPYLKYLDFGSNGIGDDGVKKMCGHLRRNPSLQILDL